MQTDTKPTTGIEFGAVIASSEDEGELQRVVKPHGMLHVVDVDRDIPTSDHGNSILSVSRPTTTNNRDSPRTDAEWSGQIGGAPGRMHDRS
jgi:hypothetical protein